MQIYNNFVFPPSQYIQNLQHDYDTKPSALKSFRLQSQGSDSVRCKLHQKEYLRDT